MKLLRNLSLLLLSSAPWLLAQQADMKFSNISTQFLKGFWVANPIYATQTGVHDYDGKIDDNRPRAIARELTRLQSFRKKLSALNPAQLSPTASIDCRMLIENIDDMIFQISELREHEWNPLNATGTAGNAMASLLYQEFAPLERRLASAVERANALPAYLKRAKDNLKRAPAMHVETAIGQNQGNISLYKDELLNAAKGVPAELRGKVEAASRTAVAALERFGKWLADSLRPRATMDTKLGKELLEKKIVHAVKSALTPEQILQRAESEKRRVHGEMYALALPLYRQYYAGEPTGLDSLAMIRRVFDKIVLEHTTKDSLMATIRMIMPELEQFVREKDLLTLDPTQPLVIRETPEYERGISVASLESPGPLEKNMKSFYNVTPIAGDWTPEQVESYLREYNNWSLRDLCIHEGIPGHYVQLYYGNRFPSIIRSVFGSGPMVEGWAVYAERMMVEQGYMNNDPRMKLINLKWYIRTVLNAIIDQQIHAYGMTQTEMMDLLMKEGFQEEREAAGKWRRANLTSAQLSTYFVGYQEIADLREEFKKQQGEKFTVKNFNETFMSFGSPPVKYIREMMIGE
jgi:uncharacterized protein (DUF885 family)